MTAVRTRTYKSGNSEAVRLPKDMAFGLGTTVTLERRDDGVLIKPVPDLSMREWVEEFRKRPGPSDGWTRLPVDIPDRARW